MSIHHFSMPDPHPERHHPPAFSLGRLVATRGAIALLQQIKRSPYEFVNRHQRGDWGELCDEDRQSNDEAIGQRLRILSSYQIEPDHKLWIITEADRSATTLLLPEEY